ncbi:hypothetical protein HOLleu_42936 [Holothuria leucospilota]|uniref:Uncharacterized protein n=1 Tax=Holothuria leucospilota TaxID=206669 RepID=A0A9Q0YCC9_HOLLE|nr:hypothetical protein HOLleu_42936 [Holothuria leucospilota]
MGHDIRTHREYYRLPEQTLQLAKVSKVLFSRENGNLHSMPGKSLDDIQISPDEEVPVDESIMDDSQKPSATTDDSDVTDVEDNSEHLGSEAISPAENSVVKKTRSVKKKPWTPQEKQIIATKFINSFVTSKLPGKKEILDVINQEPLLKSRKWTNVKDFILNQLKKNDPMDFFQTL